MIEVSLISLKFKSYKSELPLAKHTPDIIFESPEFAITAYQSAIEAWRLYMKDKGWNFKNRKLKRIMNKTLRGTLLEYFQRLRLAQRKVSRFRG